MDVLQQQLRDALAQIELLKKENNYLKELLKQHNIAYGRKQQDSKKQAILRRISRFQSVFKGRADVYAVMQQTNEGNASFVLAQQNGAFLPLTEKVIYNHLIGKQIIGIAPLMKDHTCYFLTLQFETNDWQNDALSFVQVCQQLHVPAALERTQSGHGCRVWIFFAEAIGANIARKLGNLLLTKTKEIENKALDSYRQMIPSEEADSHSGIGKFIALPLQKKARAAGNSEFVDTSFRPFPNQWEFLEGIVKLTSDSVSSLIAQLEQQNNDSEENRTHTRNLTQLLHIEYTSFKSNVPEEEQTIQTLYEEIMHDDNRNEQIFNDVLEALEHGKRPLVLTEDKKHAALLEKKFNGFVKHIVVLTDEMSITEENERLQKIQSMPVQAERVIIATEAYFKERFDKARVDSLFLTFPIANLSNLEQYVRKLHHVDPNQAAISVYDYVDAQIPLFLQMFTKRKNAFKRFGFTIHIDFSKMDFN